MFPSRVMGDRCLVYFEACECKYGDLKSGHLFISAQGWLYEEGELFEFRGDNVLLMDLDVSTLI